LNLLDEYSKQYLDELIFILKNNVDLDDEYVSYTQLNTKNKNEKTIQYQNYAEQFTSKLMEQPDFIEDCITLCADASFNNDFIKMFTDDENNNDDDDDYMSIFAILQSISLLLLMGSLDDEDRNNWRLWKKLLISDVSNSSPVLHSDRKFGKENVFYLAQTMASIIGVKSLDVFLGQTELDTLLK
ncbi:unnamed protein product, partial [Adineta ricciae]